MQRTHILALVIALATPTLSGCSQGEQPSMIIRNDTTPQRVRAGDYAAAGFTMHVDRDVNTATIRADSGEEVVLSFETRPEGTWSRGCGGAPMEALVFPKAFTLGDLAFQSPALVAECGESGGDELVDLRDDALDTLDGAPLSASCSGLLCLRFAPKP